MTIHRFQEEIYDRSNQTYCVEIARDHQLSLLGTATQGKVWFLLEYPAAWDAKAFDACNIPEEVKAHLHRRLRGRAFC